MNFITDDTDEGNAEAASSKLQIPSFVKSTSESVPLRRA
jgi:hypothetical protein